MVTTTRYSVIFQKIPSRVRVAQKIPSSFRVAGTCWGLAEAAMGKCTPPSYKSVTPSKSPGCTMKSHSRWVLLWFEEIFLHHRILSSYSKLSTLQGLPQDHNLKTED